MTAGMDKAAICPHCSGMGGDGDERCMFCGGYGRMDMPTEQSAVAVLDRAIAWGDETYGNDAIYSPGKARTDELRQARAAVAEVYAQRDALVEALRYAVDNPDFDSERFDALARAALARCGGAK
jgi:hypothetical protein